MKFTPEMLLGEEEAQAKPKKEKPPKKERPPKKEKPPKKEQPPKKEKPKKRPPKRQKPELVSDDTMAMPEETANFEEVQPEKKPLSRGAVTGIVIAIVFGFLLFVAGMRGMIGAMALEDLSAYQPAKTYDPSYQAALDASEEDFEAVNNERLTAKAEDQAAEAPAEETPAEEPAEEEEGIQAEDLTNATSKDEQIQLLQDEVERLKTEAEEAKSSAATMEQELNNAKALLEASEAREAQLRSDLDAATAGTK